MADWQNLLTTVTKQAIGTVKPGTPTPMKLYSDAAPRVQRILGQYDAAAPGIDWLIKWWPVALLGSFALGVGASYLAQVIYAKRRGGK